MITEEQKVKFAQWLNQAQAEVAADRIEQKRQQDILDVQSVMETRAAWEKFYDQVAALLPEEMRPFVVRKMIDGGITPETQRPGGIVTVRVDLGREPKPLLKMNVTVESTVVFSTYFSPFEVEVVHPKLGSYSDDDDDLYILIRDSSKETLKFTTVEPAVVAALEMYDLYDKLSEELEQKKSEQRLKKLEDALEKAVHESPRITEIRQEASWGKNRREEIEIAVDSQDASTGLYESALITLMATIAEGLVRLVEVLEEK